MYCSLFLQKYGHICKTILQEISSRSSYYAMISDSHAYSDLPSALHLSQDVVSLSQQCPRDEEKHKE